MPLFTGTGIRFSNVQGLFERYVSSARDHGKDRFFTCAYSPADRGGFKEEGEDIDVVETMLKEAAAIIATGEFVDAEVGRSTSSQRYPG